MYVPPGRFRCAQKNPKSIPAKWSEDLKRIKFDALQISYALDAPGARSEVLDALYFFGCARTSRVTWASETCHLDLSSLGWIGPPGDGRASAGPCWALIWRSALPPDRNLPVPLAERA